MTQPEPRIDVVTILSPSDWVLVDEPGSPFHNMRGRVSSECSPDRQGCQISFTSPNRLTWMQFFNLIKLDETGEPILDRYPEYNPTLPTITNHSPDPPTPGDNIVTANDEIGICLSPLLIISPQAVKGVEDREGYYICSIANPAYTRSADLHLQ